MTTHFTAHEIKEYMPANFRPDDIPGRLGLRLMKSFRHHLKRSLSGE